LSAGTFGSKEITIFLEELDLLLEHGEHVLLVTSI
jgi:hypothetical protein